MQKLAVAIAALGTFVGASAFAADMAVKAPPPPPASAGPVINWTGFYLGGNVGGVLEHASGSSDFVDSAPTVGVFTTNPQSNAFNKSAVIGGGQIGYNWQLDPRWVVGVESDWDFTDTGYSFCRQTTTTAAACFDNGSGFETIGSSTRWLATARARLGVTAGNFLFYGTGGAAWGRVDTTLAQICPSFGCGVSSVPLTASNTSGTTKSGWVAGLGAAMQLQGNWSVRLEWLHIDLGTITDQFATSGLFAGNPAHPTTETTVWLRSERYDVIRVGLDYRFWKG